ncbi:hypothetical protein BN946_scf185015.g102 [Trametes cinnabarina]|uniref:Uncharacterized protein n=1 Tax=Pycnoporus cinnabarinus TaxID=5643 RepID=A0A060SNI8_PYCCI|nr:hypothetical protein BN946_scf185015.g102 [Trametes cinnabarina]
MAPPQPFRPALLVVDMQEDFCPPDGSLAVPGGRDIISLINELLRLPFVLKVATKDHHPPEHVSFASNHPGAAPFLSTCIITNPLNPSETYETQLWPDHCVVGTPGNALVPELDAARRLNASCLLPPPTHEASKHVQTVPTVRRAQPPHSEAERTERACTAAHTAQGSLRRREQQKFKSVGAWNVAIAAGARPQPPPPPCWPLPIVPESAVNPADNNSTLLRVKYAPFPVQRPPARWVVFVGLVLVLAQW